MKLMVLSIEEVNLPNYQETISSGRKSYTREAPLLAKYRAVIKHGEVSEELYFEIREQKNSPPLIDEYYEDQVYDALHRILSFIEDTKKRKTAYNELLSKLTLWIFEIWEGKQIFFPLEYEINT